MMPYAANNRQPVAMLLGTRLHNVVLPTLFKIVNNIEQHCYSRFSDAANLLTTMTNVATTLNPVILQARIIFWLCGSYYPQKVSVYHYVYTHLRFQISKGIRITC